MPTATLRETTEKLRKSSDQIIVAGTKQWVLRERFSTAMLITHLAEVAAKRLFIDRTHSMFSYCVDELGLEPGCVWTRLQVANCCRKFPELLDALAEGSINLSVAALLAPALTHENKGSLIAAAKGKSKRVVEEVLADLHPKDPAPARIRAHREAPFFTDFSPATTAPEEAKVPPATPPAKGNAKIIPLGNLRYDLKFSFDAAQKAKLERLGELLGIGAFGPHLATLVARAIEIALKAKDPAQKSVRTSSAALTKNQEENNSRYVSMALKKDALKRAEYRCQHTGHDGHRCTQKSSLQLDHIHPFAWRGATSYENLQALCPGHHREKTLQQQGPWVCRKG